MLKDEKGNRVKLNADVFCNLMKEDERTITDIMQIIAAKCHVSIHAVEQWKKGYNSPGDFEYVQIIAEVLGVEYQKLLMYEVVQNNSEKVKEIENEEKGMVDELNSSTKDNIWKLAKEKLKEEQFKKSVCAGVVAFLCMCISGLIDKTGDYKVGWGFLLIMSWSFDYLLHNFPNIYGLVVFRKDELLVRAYRVINLSLSIFVVSFVIITQCMLLRL